MKLKIDDLGVVGIIVDDWSFEKSFKPKTIVTDYRNWRTYISRRAVPKHIELTNTYYWKPILKPFGGGSGDAFTRIKVGNNTLVAVGEDEFELIAGENVTIEADTESKTITINAEGKEQVQSDWNQEDDTQPDYIKNKPNVEIGGDKPYDPEHHSGLGRKTLQLKEGGSNILTQEDFDQENTVYVINYDFDLNDPEGENPITLPEGTVLDFNGGSISNGYLEGEASIINQPDDLYENVNCSNLNILTAKHLSFGDISDTFDDYEKDGIVDMRHEQNIVSSAFFYDIQGLDTIYCILTGADTPKVRLLFYDKDFVYISHTGSFASTIYDIEVPEGAAYVTFLLSYNKKKIAEINTLIKNIIFSFLNNVKVYISSDMKRGVDGNIPKSSAVSLSDISKIYVNASGRYLNTLNEDNYNGICIPYSRFKDYQYLEVQTNTRATRIHMLKEEPKESGTFVVYSDYYGESILLSKNVTSQIYIPSDVRYIFILCTTEGVDDTPTKVVLRTTEYFTEGGDYNAVDLSNRNMNLYSKKFMHWNIGNFSKGSTPYTKIDGNNYNQKKNYGHFH